jgi:hypothetical protein
MKTSEQKLAGLDESFGMWKGRGLDGVEYQERLRKEWEAEREPALFDPTKKGESVAPAAPSLPPSAER